MMSLLDLAIIGIIGLAFLQGAMRGFIVELVAVAGVVGAFIAAIKASGNIADKLVDSTGIDTTYADPMAFFIVFFAVILLSSIIVAAIPNPLKGKGGKILFTLDHLFGGIIAPIKPIVFVGVFSLIAFTYIKNPTDVFGSKSTLRPFVLSLGKAMSNMIPANNPFSQKNFAKGVPTINTSDWLGGLPNVKDKKDLEKLLEERIK
ncbi:MAG: CvpA family protein [Mariprofundaceae bacterium]|nr:CvpA family protein [Mariprofundaceae bacterium]